MSTSCLAVICRQDHHVIKVKKKGNRNTGILNRDTQHPLQLTVQQCQHSNSRHTFQRREWIVDSSSTCTLNENEICRFQEVQGG